jgi:hypothetical protein
MRLVLSRGSAALLLLLVGLAAGAARAQEYDGYRAERTRPPASAADGLAMPLPRTLGDLVPAFGLVLDYAHQPLLARSSYGGQAGAVVAHRVIAHVIAALGVTDRLELHLRAPLVFQAGDSPVISEIAFAAPDAATFADGVLGGSVRILGEGEQGFHLGLTAEVLFPFTSASGFVSDREVSARGLVTSSVALPAMTIALAAGASYRPERPLLGAGRSASELDLALGLVVPAFLRTTLDVELLVSTGLRGDLAFQTRGTSLELVLGGRHQLENGLALELGGAIGFLRAPGTPTFRVFLGVRWALPPAPPSDEDGDGFVGDEDRCPAEAEDRDHNYDDDGCPEPDDDEDGIVDASDACAREAEDRDGWDDDDGCPDPDDDGDGWADADDACARIPGGDSRRGCPRMIRVDGRDITLLEDLVFVEGTAQLVPTDGIVLDEIAAVMSFDRTGARWRIAVRPVRVSRRDDGSALAEQRERAIAEALLAREVAPFRLVVADTHELVAELEAAGASAPASPHLVTITFVAPPPLPTTEAP